MSASRAWPSYFAHHPRPQPSRLASSTAPETLKDDFMKTILETDRLCLREFVEDDVDSLFALDSDHEVMRYITDGEPRSREQIEQALNRVWAYYQKHPGFGIWLIELKVTRKFLGWVCLKHLGDTEMIEVGYRLMKDAWNQGYATEAAAAVIEYGFHERGLTKIVAVTHPDNTASQRVLEKCGLQPNGSGTYYGSECSFFELAKSRADIVNAFNVWAKLRL